MKKRTEKSSVSMDRVEADLKTLFQTEDCFLSGADDDELQPTIDLERAQRLFDDLRAAHTGSMKQSAEPRWTHPSVLTLGESDPISEIVLRARGAVLDAIERGWNGPPYNPFTLAEMRGVKLLPTDEVLDARTRSDSKGQFTIEFNPQR